jgi:hypothetical protein
VTIAGEREYILSSLADELKLLGIAASLRANPRLPDAVRNLRTLYEASASGAITKPERFKPLVEAYGALLMLCGETP